MGERTITLTDDAYERLDATRRDDESFSDLVRRLTSGVDLSEYHGALSGRTADAVAAEVTGRRDPDAGTVRDQPPGPEQPPDPGSES